MDNNVAPIDILNDDCVFFLLSFLHINTILAFGVTNINFNRVVSMYINHHRITDFSFYRVPLPVLNEILLRFGGFFINLNIDFGEENTDMNFFNDEIGRCMIFNVQSLTFHVNIDERMYPYPYQPNYILTQIVNRFQQIVHNVIDSINRNYLQNLRHFSLTIDLDFRHASPTSYLFWNNMGGIIEMVEIFFGSLRRGNLVFDYYPYPVAYVDRTRYVFEFDILEMN